MTEDLNNFNIRNEILLFCVSLSVILQLISNLNDYIEDQKQQKKDEV
jgi:hypothetical protein